MLPGQNCINFEMYPNYRPRADEITCSCSTGIQRSRQRSGQTRGETVYDRMKPNDGAAAGTPTPIYTVVRSRTTGTRSRTGRHPAVCPHNSHTCVPCTAFRLTWQPHDTRAERARCDGPAPLHRPVTRVGHAVPAARTQTRYHVHLSSRPLLTPCSSRQQPHGRLRPRYPTAASSLASRRRPCKPRGR